MSIRKKRNLFEEIREGLEAFRHRRDSLPRHELPAPDVPERTSAHAPRHGARRRRGKSRTTR